MKKNDSKTKYAAFISYRHVSPDKEIARILQFLLEYNLVRPNKQVPRHIRKVFLDVSELPTQEDLDAGILEALDNSECLYVICSPDLPKSKYCMREISYFKEIHGGSLDRVGTLLVRGDPQEAYPSLLRTKQIPDPEDPTKTIEVDIEPLYADIRAKTFLGSLWKLLSSEYLRLACRYYRCSYDELKKRHKRNAFYFLIASIITIGCIVGALCAKEMQVQRTMADSYAAYANEQTRADNELLALALCTHTDCMDTPAYHTALSSAVVQLDHKNRNQPVAKMLETRYFHGAFTNYYLSSTENKLVVCDDNVWQIIDAHNGKVLLQLPCESAFVLGTKPSAYVLLKSAPDEQGIFRDYVVLMDLETNEAITQFPFRESSGEYPDYSVKSAIEAGGLYMLTDHEVPVAFFTKDGQQLTEKAFAYLVTEKMNSPLPEPEGPYFFVKDKRKKSYVLKDSEGNTLLNIGKSYQAAAFSADNGLFACAADGVLTVYDTRTWDTVNAVYLENMNLQSLQLLSGSSYYLAGYRKGSDTVTYIGDWRTGEVLMTTDAVVIQASGEQAFYTIHDGVVCRYQYNDLATDQRGQAVMHIGDHCLSSAEDGYLLRNTASDSVLMETDAMQACTDETMQSILLRFSGRLVCCDGKGAVRWELPCESRCAAMAPDGSRIAFMDGAGNVQVHDGANGKLVCTVDGAALAQAGHVEQLVCSGRGVGVLGREGALWIPDGAEAAYLGRFPSGVLFSDGMLVLENLDRVNDFRLYDTEKLEMLQPFADNTGIWDYNPKTKYLIRHVEASGNKPSLSLEIWQRKEKELTLHGKIELTDNRIDVLCTDSTGEYLSLISDGRSRVVRLKDLTGVLDAAGAVYYEANALHGVTLYGQYQYRMPMQETAVLRQWAMDALKSPVSTRTLTEEEVTQYSITP